MSSLTGNHGSHHRREPSRLERERSRFNIPQVHFNLHRNVNWVSRVGLLGAIGWAIIVPTLLGLALGLWIDTMFPSRFSWASLLLPVGLFLGCLNAGYWFRQDFTPKD